MKPANRIISEIRMLVQRSRNPRVRQLQQGRASSGKKNGGLPVNLPADRIWAEKAFAWFARQFVQCGEQLLHICLGYVMLRFAFRPHVSLDAKKLVTNMRLLSDDQIVSL